MLMKSLYACTYRLTAMAYYISIWLALCSGSHKLLASREFREDVTELIEMVKKHGDPDRLNQPLYDKVTNKKYIPLIVLAQQNLDTEPFRKVGICAEALMRQLLEVGANPNVQDAFQNTPLAYALKHSKKSIITLLLARGARADIQLREPLTIQFVDSITMPSDRLSDMDYIDIARKLCDAGLDVVVQDSHGRTAKEILCDRYKQEELNNNGKKYAYVYSIISSIFTLHK